MNVFVLVPTSSCGAMESVMCDVINVIRLKRRDATKSKIKKKLHQKFGNVRFKIGHSTAVLIISS